MVLGPFNIPHFQHSVATPILKFLKDRVNLTWHRSLWERAQEYGRRLKPVAHQLAMRFAIRSSEGLVEASRAPEEAEGAADLAGTEIITEISTRAQVSFQAILVDPKSRFLTFTARSPGPT